VLFDCGSGRCVPSAKCPIVDVMIYDLQSSFHGSSTAAPPVSPRMRRSTGRRLFRLVLASQICFQAGTFDRFVENIGVIDFSDDLRVISDDLKAWGDPLSAISDHLIAVSDDLTLAGDGLEAFSRRHSAFSPFNRFGNSYVAPT
jgi:hypothetical protein